MAIITTNEDLKNFCDGLKSVPFIAIDTEFLRERTYYPKLCLIQLSGPSGDAIAIDPIAAPDLDLTPLADLLKDEAIVKVMHSGRQDMEIFYQLFGFLPSPYYDTQIAAMVCGHGEQIGYEALCREILNIQIDKSKQYTDWSIRPLSQAQLDYALGDVIHLRDIYQKLDSELKQSGRDEWIKEEMQAMQEVTLYDPPLDNLWHRIRLRSNTPHKRAILQALAIWREEFARKRDLPRNHVLKDDSLAEIALQQPKTAKELAKTRGISERFANSDKGQKLLKIVASKKKTPKEDCPEKPLKTPLPGQLQSSLEMLKMLLRIQATEQDVAPKLIAKSEDLERLAMGDTENLAILDGWRHEIFGKYAEALLQGKIAFTLQNNKIKILQLDDE